MKSIQTLFATANVLYFAVIIHISCFDKSVFIQLNMKTFYYNKNHKSFISTSKISCASECKASVKTCTYVVFKTFGNGRVECFLLDAENATSNIFSDDNDYELWTNGKYDIFFHYTVIRSYLLTFCEGNGAQKGYIRQPI